jgi:transposase
MKDKKDIKNTFDETFNKLHKRFEGVRNATLVDLYKVFNKTCPGYRKILILNFELPYDIYFEEDEEKVAYCVIQEIEKKADNHVFAYLTNKEKNKNKRVSFNRLINSLPFRELVNFCDAFAEYYKQEKFELYEY